MRKKWDLPSGQRAALIVLGLAFAVGGGIGCLLAVLTGGEGGRELSAYLSDYLTLAESGQLPESLVWSLLCHMKYLLAVLLLGVTSLGVVGLPVVFGIRGFLFSFSVACFCRVFGGKGLFPAFSVLGFPALFWGPALFLAGVQSLSGSQQLLRRSFGDGRGGISFSGVYWYRVFLCVVLTLIGALLECWIVPELLQAAARVVL